MADESLNIIATGTPAGTYVIWNGFGSRFEFYIKKNLVATIQASAPDGEIKSNGIFQLAGRVVELDPAGDPPNVQAALIEYDVSESAWNIATAPSMVTAMRVYATGNVWLSRVIETPAQAITAGLPDSGFGGALDLTADGVLTVSVTRESLSDLRGDVWRNVEIGVDVSMGAFSVSSTGRRGSFASGDFDMPPPAVVVFAGRGNVASGFLTMPAMGQGIVPVRVGVATAALISPHMAASAAGKRESGINAWSKMPSFVTVSGGNRISFADGDLWLGLPRLNGYTAKPDAGLYQTFRVVAIERRPLSPYQVVTLEPLERPLDR